MINPITLWLLGGVARFTEQPRTWHHEFWIAIAGPIVSVTVGIVCYLVVLIVPPGFDGTLFVFGYLAILNVFLVLFHMLPAFPARRRPCSPRTFRPDAAVRASDPARRS